MLATGLLGVTGTGWFWGGDTGILVLPGIRSASPFPAVESVGFGSSVRPGMEKAAVAAGPERRVRKGRATTIFCSFIIVSPFV